MARRRYDRQFQEEVTEDAPVLTGESALRGESALVKQEEAESRRVAAVRRMLPGAPPAPPAPPGLFEKLQRDFEALKELPYEVLEFDLSVAGTRVDERQWNEITVLQITGGSQLNIRLNRHDAPSIPVTDALSIVHEVDKIYFSWGAVAGATAVVALGWRLDR